MARPNIAMLNMPPLAYRPDRHAKDFENRRASEDEDQLRANRLFCAWDCEFYPSLLCYQPHSHGVAAGGMIDVLDQLRGKLGSRTLIPRCDIDALIERSILSSWR